MDNKGQDELNRLKKKPGRKLIGGLILLAALCVRKCRDMAFANMNKGL